MNDLRTILESVLRAPDVDAVLDAMPVGWQQALEVGLMLDEIRSHMPAIDEDGGWYRFELQRSWLGHAWSEDEVPTETVQAQLWSAWAGQELHKPLFAPTIHAALRALLARLTAVPR